MAEQDAADNQGNKNPFHSTTEGEEVASVVDAWNNDNSLTDTGEFELSDDPFDLVEEEPHQASNLRRKEDAVLIEQTIDLGEDDPTTTKDHPGLQPATDSTATHSLSDQADVAAEAVNQKSRTLKNWLPWIAAAIIIPIVTIGLTVLIKAFTDAKAIKNEVSALQGKIIQLNQIVEKLPRNTELDLLRNDLDSIHTSQRLFKNQLDDFKTLKDETTQLSASLKKQLLVIAEDRRSMIKDLTGMHTELTKTQKSLQQLTSLAKRIGQLEKQLARRKADSAKSKKTVQKQSAPPAKPVALVKPSLRYRILHVLESSQSAVYAVAVSPDGLTLASAGTDNKLRLWDMQTGVLRKVLEGHSNWVTDVRFSPTGKWLASCSWDGTIKIWDSSTGAQVRTLLGHKRQIRTLAFSPDGTLLASGGTSNSILLWNPVTGKAQGSFDDHINWIKDLEFSPDGKQLASASLDDTVRLWNTQQGTPSRTIADHRAAVNAVAFSPDGRYLATASADTTIRLYPLSKGPSRVFSGHTEAINSLLFTPDSLQLLSGSGDGSIRVWDVATGKTLQRIMAHDGAVTALALSPNGARMLSAGTDGKVKIWEPYLSKQ